MDIKRREEGYYLYRERWTYREEGRETNIYMDMERGEKKEKDRKRERESVRERGRV